MRFAGRANDALAAFDGEDVAARMVLWQTGRGRLGTTEDCRALRDRYGLENLEVWFDATGALQDAGLASRHVHYVLIPGARIFHRRAFNDSTFEAAIRQALDLR